MELSGLDPVHSGIADKCEPVLCLRGCGSFVCRFQSGSATLSGWTGDHHGPSLGRRPDGEHVHHDGGDDGSAGAAHGIAKISLLYIIVFDCRVREFS